MLLIFVPILVIILLAVSYFLAPSKPDAENLSITTLPLCSATHTVAGVCDDQLCSKVKKSKLKSKILDKIKNSPILKKLFDFLKNHPFIVISILAPIFFFCFYKKSYINYYIIIDLISKNEYWMLILITIFSLFFTYIIRKYIIKKFIIIGSIQPILAKQDSPTATLAELPHTTPQDDKGLLLLRRSSLTEALAATRPSQMSQGLLRVRRVGKAERSDRSRCLLSLRTSKEVSVSLKSKNNPLILNTDKQFKVNQEIKINIRFFKFLNFFFRDCSCKGCKNKRFWRYFFFHLLYDIGYGHYEDIKTMDYVVKAPISTLGPAQHHSSGPERKSVSTSKLRHVLPYQFDKNLYIKNILATLAAPPHHQVPFSYTPLAQFDFISAMPGYGRTLIPEPLLAKQDQIHQREKILKIFRYRDIFFYLLFNLIIKLNPVSLFLSLFLMGFYIFGINLVNIQLLLFTIFFNLTGIVLMASRFVNEFIIKSMDSIPELFLKNINIISKIPLKAITPLISSNFKSITLIKVFNKIIENLLTAKRTISMSCFTFYASNQDEIIPPLASTSCARHPFFSTLKQDYEAGNYINYKELFEIKNWGSIHSISNYKYKYINSRSVLNCNNIVSTDQLESGFIFGLYDSKIQEELDQNLSANNDFRIPDLVSFAVVNLDKKLVQIFPESIKHHSLISDPKVGPIIIDNKSKIFEEVDPELIATNFLIILKEQIELGNIEGFLSNWKNVDTVFSYPGNAKYLPQLADTIINNTGYEFTNILISEKVLDKDVFFYIRYINPNPWDRLNYYFYNGTNDILGLYNNTLQLQNNLDRLIINTIMYRNDLGGYIKLYKEGLPIIIQGKKLEPINLVLNLKEYRLIPLEIFSISNNIDKNIENLVSWIEEIQGGEAKLETTLRRNTISNENYDPLRSPLALDLIYEKKFLGDIINIPVKYFYLLNKLNLGSEVNTIFTSYNGTPEFFNKVAKVSCFINDNIIIKRDLSDQNFNKIINLIKKVYDCNNSIPIEYLNFFMKKVVISTFNIENDTQSLIWFLKKIEYHSNNITTNTNDFTNQDSNINNISIRNNTSLNMTSSIFRYTDHNHTYTELNKPNIFEKREMLKNKEIELNRVCVFIKNFK